MPGWSAPTPNGTRCGAHGAAPGRTRHRARPGSCGPRSGPRQNSWTGSPATGWTWPPPGRATLTGGWSPTATTPRGSSARSCPGHGSAAPDGTRWLFPGRASVRPVTALAVTRQLNQKGIHLRAGRTAALVDLAGQLPPAVLASLLGLPGHRGPLEPPHRERLDRLPARPCRYHQLSGATAARVAAGWRVIAAVAGQK